MIAISFHRNPLIRIAEEESLDYFYRMGGGNCYPGYDNWHALALVLVVYFEKICKNEFLMKSTSIGKVIV